MRKRTERNKGEGERTRRALERKIGGGKKVRLEIR